LDPDTLTDEKFFSLYMDYLYERQENYKLIVNALREVLKN